MNIEVWKIIPSSSRCWACTQKGENQAECEMQPCVSSSILQMKIGILVYLLTPLLTLNIHSFSACCIHLLLHQPLLHQLLKLDISINGPSGLPFPLNMKFNLTGDLTAFIECVQDAAIHKVAVQISSCEGGEWREAMHWHFVSMCLHLWTSVCNKHNKWPVWCSCQRLRSH